GLVDGLRRVVLVVEVLIVDLPSLDAAVRLVPVLEVRIRAPADACVRGRDPAQGDGSADLHLVRRDAGIEAGRAGSAGGERQCAQDDCDAPQEVSFAGPRLRPVCQRIVSAENAVAAKAASTSAAPKAKVGIPGESETHFGA